VKGSEGVAEPEDRDEEGEELPYRQYQGHCKQVKVRE